MDCAQFRTKPDTTTNKQNFANEMNRCESVELQWEYSWEHWNLRKKQMVLMDLELLFIHRSYIY